MTTTSLTGWCHCRTSPVLHYRAAGGELLCGRVLVPDRPFVPSRGVVGIDPDAAPRCSNCEALHLALWANEERR